MAEHIRELVAFCRRVAAPLPAWDEVLLLDTTDPRVRYDGGWLVASDCLATIAAFAPRFEALLKAGYSWINLSAHGIFQNRLVVGVELPRESAGVPVGLTCVNYSGPTFDPPGTPAWALTVTIDG